MKKYRYGIHPPCPESLKDDEAILASLGPPPDPMETPTFDCKGSVMSEKQEDLFGVPYAKGSDTSKEAAESMIPHLGRIANLVLRHIVDQGIRGATCDEIEVDLNLRHQTASARVSELAKRGMIVDRGYRRPTRSGRRATVWESKHLRVSGQ